MVPLGTKGGRVVVAAFAAAFEKGERLTAAGCVEGGREKVLKIDRPMAGGFSGLTALWAEGCGLPYGLCL